MPDLDALKGIIRESGVLTKNGQYREALRLLDGAIADAKRQGQGSWVMMLSQHAAVISEPLRDLELVAKFCKDAVDGAPEDALAQYGLADILHRQGKASLARQHAIKSYSLVAGSDTKEGKGLVELIAKRWPQVVR